MIWHLLCLFWSVGHHLEVVEAGTAGLLEGCDSLWGPARLRAYAWGPVYPPQSEQHFALPWISVAGIPASKLVEAHGSFASATCTVCRRPFPGEHIWVSCHADGCLLSALCSGSNLEKWHFISIVVEEQWNRNGVKCFSLLLNWKSNVCLSNIKKYVGK